jgi:hypothetical protein
MRNLNKSSFDSPWVGLARAQPGQDAHFFYVQEHPRPVKPQADAKQHARNIEVAVNKIAMECHKNEREICSNTLFFRNPLLMASMATK